MTASTPTDKPPPAASPSSSPNPNPNPSGPPPSNTQSHGTTSHPKPPTAPQEPLTGFKSVLEHTGIPRSVLTWKPRLPSRNWTIFWTVSGTLLYLWYDDRKQCKVIKEETLRKVEYLGKQPIEGGSLGEVRKVKVFGARWPEDGDDDRALRHFRKYMKPYLVAAAIDYEPLPPPIIHGSVARHIHKTILTKRRQQLGLEPTPTPLSLPVALDPSGAEQRELDGGTILVGRLSLKEYMEGLKRGWGGGVDDWSLEQQVKNKVEGDGIFESKPILDLEKLDTQSSDIPNNNDTVEPLPITPPSLPKTPLSASGLSFLSRPPPPTSITPPNSSSVSDPPPIPDHFHIPPNPLPPQPPLILLPFTNHMGFKQFPNMIYDFFTERHRVRQGADAALALIYGQTRPFEGPTNPFSSSSRNTSEFASDTDSSNDSQSSEKKDFENDGTISKQGGDLDFDLKSESYIRKSYDKFLSTLSTARREYYDALGPRIDLARGYEEGTRQLTESEQSGKTKLETIEGLKDERIKKEMRWQGGEDGYEIIKKGTGVVWDPKWEGWLKVFVKPEGSVEESFTKQE